MVDRERGKTDNGWRGSVVMDGGNGLVWVNIQGLGHGKRQHGEIGLGLERTATISTNEDDHIDTRTSLGIKELKSMVHSHCSVFRMERTKPTKCDGLNRTKLDYQEDTLVPISKEITHRRQIII